MAEKEKLSYGLNHSSETGIKVSIYKYISNIPLLCGFMEINKQ
jgi:hypothetical protein